MEEESHRVREQVDEAESEMKALQVEEWRQGDALEEVGREVERVTTQIITFFSSLHDKLKKKEEEQEAKERENDSLMKQLKEVSLSLSLSLSVWRGGEVEALLAGPSI